MPRYVVHIGPHKTGTTYIQSRLDAARDRLRAVGVTYPATWRAGDAVPSHLRLFERIRHRQFSELQRELAELAVDADGLVVVAGSLYVVGTARADAVAASVPWEEAGR